MSDGRSHFKNKEVQDLCDEWGIKHHVITAYSPWINGLVEGMNRLLLYVLTQLCAPEVGEDGWQWEDLLKTWPDHWDKAILNPYPQLADSTSTQIRPEGTNAGNSSEHGEHTTGSQYIHPDAREHGQTHDVCGTATTGQICQGSMPCNMMKSGIQQVGQEIKNG